jgi:hypothetical protein
MISAATTNNNKSDSKTKSGESGIPQNNKISSKDKILLMISNSENENRQ